MTFPLPRFATNASVPPTSGQAFSSDMENAVLFLRSQREHKALLERYNPLFNLTAEEHIKATANRVGLNMPITPDGSNPEGKE
ncbi:hypothetical protein K523DRAFT_344827 [Schizophyllum commune Tattone D]|nr:hypothetical protein K523DRAFT_344827 [Schizophyllum commune Tattone D]